jgi:hypothetical protein
MRRPKEGNCSLKVIPISGVKKAPKGLKNQTGVAEPAAYS